LIFQATRTKNNGKNIALFTPDAAKTTVGEMVIIYYTFPTVNPYCGIVATGLQRLQHVTTQVGKLFFAGFKVEVSLTIKPSARLKQAEGKTLSSSTAYN
jgi:hypothetical protein